MSFLIHRTVGEKTLLRSVEGETLRIGRDAGAGLRLDDAAVALDHAVIRRDGPHWVLEDRGSVTGTYAGGRPVDRLTLSGDDTIEIGGYRLRVQVTHPDDPLFLHLAAVDEGVAEASRPGRERRTLDTGALSAAETAAIAAARAGSDLAPAATKEAPVDAAAIAAAEEAVTKEARVDAAAIAMAHDAAAVGERTTGELPIATTDGEPAIAAAPSPEAAKEPQTAVAASEPKARPVRPAPSAVGARPRSRERTESEGFDYAAAYSLARPGWTKAALTLALAVVALVALGALAAGSHRPLMPGISSAHALIVSGQPVAASADGAGAVLFEARAREVAARGCAACHRPWRGASAIEDGCAVCHRPQSAPHAPLLAADRANDAAVAAVACTACHPEHRDQPLVRLQAAGDCVACHRDLGALTAGESTLTPAITSFATDHPELVITLPAADGAARRLSLADAAGADPSSLEFGHRLHRVREAGEAGPEGLRGPEGPVELACTDCHVADPTTGRMAPVSFEAHCQSCHRLSFDAAYPDREAPHATPREVEDYLVGLYSRAAGGGDQGASLRQRRLGVIAGRDRARLPAGVDRKVADAARTLFRSGCDLCHLVDLDAVPLPEVAPAAVPVRWMPGARFSHLDHDAMACAGCHPNAAASQATADVLLPGIAVCRECHGGAGLAQATTAGDRGAAWGGALACAECHGYHRDAAAATSTLTASAGAASRPTPPRSPS